jgi:hypothetical protein
MADLRIFASFFVTRFQIFASMSMKNAVFWDVAPRGSNVSEERIAYIIRRYSPPKGRFLKKPHGVTSQKTAFFTFFIPYRILH